LEGVVDAKTKLYDSLRLTGGTVFVDCGNPHLYPKAAGLNQVTYSTLNDDETSPVRGLMIDCSPYLSLSLYIDDRQAMMVNTHLIGNYNLINVVAAATVGRYFKVPSTAIKAALEGYMPQNMRSQLVDLGHGNQLILDAYNANPTSMMAALQSFNLNSAAHKGLILGDMRELGNESALEHKRILEYLAQPEVTFGDILLVGAEFTKAFESVDPAVITALGNRASVRCYANIDALCSDSAAIANIGGTVLIKGSRGIQLEKVVDVIKNR